MFGRDSEDVGEWEGFIVGKKGRLQVNLKAVGMLKLQVGKLESGHLIRLVWGAYLAFAE